MSPIRKSLNASRLGASPGPARRASSNQPNHRNRHPITKLNNLRRTLQIAVASTLIAIAITPQLASGETVLVDSLDEIEKVAKSTKPGDVIEIADGNYKLESDLELKRLVGNPDSPITVRAEHPLKVTLNGDHVVKLRHSQYLVLQGFRFRMKSDIHGKGGAVSVRGCQHCRITGNDFELDEKETNNKNQTWLTLDGLTSGNNRVDHNRFANKKKKGHFIFVTGEDDYVSQHDLIERNQFVDRSFGDDENEFETIRIGESHIGNTGGKSFTTVRENLFERCQGEDEIVSFKVGGGSFLQNTIINCHGSIVFRNGNDGTFAGNKMLNTYESTPFKKYRAGGVRFYGSGHRAFNNYFAKLNGTSAKAPLALMHGAPAGSGSLGVSDGLPATNCQIVHNTWVHCSQLRLGFESEKRPLPPSDCVFANNIVHETDDSQLLNLFEAEGIKFQGNILHASRSKETGIEGSNYSEDAFQIVDPALAERDQVMQLKSNSPAINQATQTFSFVNVDISGAPRGEHPDVGSEEYGATKKTKLLAPKDVGPTARRRE